MIVLFKENLYTTFYFVLKLSIWEITGRNFENSTEFCSKRQIFMTAGSTLASANKARLLMFTK